MFDLINTASLFNIQESGPTYVGDEWSDPELMQYLHAKKEKQWGYSLYAFRHPTNLIRSNK